MSDLVRMYVGGAWVEASSGGRRPVVNPADESAVAEVAYGGRADAERAIDAASRALPDWGRKPAAERGRILRRTADLLRERADELARTLTDEQGKPLAEAKGEVLLSADTFDWFAEEGRRAYGRTIPAAHPLKRHVVTRQPVGVVGTITPWNFPIALLSRKVAPALAAGCTVVSRPADQTPLVAVGMFRCLADAGLPPGAANLVVGDPVAVADAYFERPEVRKISFTGSTAVGKQLIGRSAAQVKRLSLELGGHAPLIVLPDADVEAVAKMAVQGKFRNNGQVCIAPSRFYVHRDIRRDFTEAAVELTRQVRVGPGTESGVVVGPMIDERARAKAEALVADARARGAAVLVGGGRPSAFERGFFFEPTVIDAPPPESRLMADEPFAPILPLLGFDDLEAVIAEANRTPYGLAAYAFTNDLTAAVRLAEGLEAGIVGINDPVPTAVPAPFGGMKESGLGRELGSEGLDAYLETKFVSFGLRG